MRYLFILFASWVCFILAVQVLTIRNLLALCCEGVVSVVTTALYQYAKQTLLWLLELELCPGSR